MLIFADSLKELVNEIFVSLGVRFETADVVTSHLVLANLKGHDSHGVGMVPSYVSALNRGLLKPEVNPELVRDKGAVALLDGNRGFGQVIGIQATRKLIELTNEHGLACVGLRNSYHLGRIGTYAELCAQAGLVSIHFVNAVGHLPIVAPWGGREARFQTNPFCCAVPRPGKLPVVLDMATSTVAFGKVRVAHFAGTHVPEGAIIDNHGHPSNDPDVMFSNPRGSLLPFGRHKGFGLAMLCELLGGALVGQFTMHPGHARPGSSINNMLMFAVDPAMFGGTGPFHEEVEQLIDYLKSCPTVEGHERILMAGEPEQRSFDQRTRNGIPIDENSWKDLVGSAEIAGVGASRIAALTGE